MTDFNAQARLGTLTHHAQAHAARLRQQGLVPAVRGLSKEALVAQAGAFLAAADALAEQEAK